MICANFHQTCVNIWKIFCYLFFISIKFPNQKSRWGNYLHDARMVSFGSFFARFCNKKSLGIKIAICVKTFSEGKGNRSRKLLQNKKRSCNIWLPAEMVLLLTIKLYFCHCFLSLFFMELCSTLLELLYVLRHKFAWSASIF